MTPDTTHALAPMPTTDAPPSRGEVATLADLQAARACPRDEQAVAETILRTCRNPAFASAAMYRKPAGRDRAGKPVNVSGVSIRLAEELARAYGNLAIQHTTTFDDDERRVSRVTCRDLQTNTMYSKDILINKTVERRARHGRVVLSQRTNSNGEPVFIVRATEDEVNTKEANAVSKATRVLILRIIPQPLVDLAVGAVSVAISSPSVAIAPPHDAPDITTYTLTDKELAPSDPPPAPIAPIDQTPPPTPTPPRPSPPKETPAPGARKSNIRQAIEGLLNHADATTREVWHGALSVVMAERGQGQAGLDAVPDRELQAVMHRMRAIAARGA